LGISRNEALTNVVRHAEATQAVVSLEIVDRFLFLRVKDNGCGFEAGEECGCGLKNLQSRLAGIDASFECRSKPGQGVALV
jgi:signal transduction histidine kinase